MNKYFFFTDKQSWLATTQEKPFGVINADEYRLCNQFTFDSSTNNIAVAAAKSILLVQNAFDSSGTPINGIVNIILKPVDPVIWEYEHVNYFIYRGIDKASLIDTNGEIIQAASPEASDVRNLLYDQQAKINEELGINEVPKSSHIGYDYAHDLADTDPFYVPDEAYIEDVIELDDDDSDLQLPIVKAGMFIGVFKDGIDAGFEIIGERIGYETKMGVLRQSEHVLNVSAYSGFEKKHMREEILHFFDPVAFYGSLTIKEDELSYDVLMKQVSGTTYEDVPLRSNNYELLNKFTNNKRVYVDFRHRTGYSYNYFSEYLMFTISNPIGQSENNISYQIFGIENIAQFQYPMGWPLTAIDLSPSTFATLFDGALQEEHDILDYQFVRTSIILRNLVQSIYENHPEGLNENTDNSLKIFLSAYSKGILNPDQTETPHLDDLKVREILVEDYGAFDDVNYKSTLDLPLFLTNDLSLTNSQRVIPSYHYIKLATEFKLRVVRQGMIPKRRNLDTSTGQLTDPVPSLIRYDKHPLDLMFPIFEMKPIFMPRLNRVSVRLYSQSNAFPIAGSYGSYYEELYTPKVGMAIDNNNYTFFTYIDNKNIMHSAKDSSKIKSHLNSSFTVGEADFLFSLTKQDLNITLNKRNISYLKTIGEPDTLVSIKPLYFTVNNAVDGLSNELDYEHFDCITITKDQFDTLELMKNQEGFSDKYRIFLGVSVFGKNPIIDGGEYRRAKLFLKGFAEDDMGNVTEKHLDTGISTYAYHKIPRRLEY